MEKRLTPEQKLILERERERLPSPSPPPFAPPEEDVPSEEDDPPEEDVPPLPQISFEEFIRRRERMILEYNQRLREIEERFLRESNRLDEHYLDYETFKHEKRIHYPENRDPDPDPV